MPAIRYGKTKFKSRQENMADNHLRCNHLPEVKKS